MKLKANFYIIKILSALSNMCAFYSNDLTDEDRISLLQLDPRRSRWGIALTGICVLPGYAKETD
jgi:hypothetical protein